MRPSFWRCAFNSFTGFHAAPKIYAVWVNPNTFQFLHRIPPDVNSTSSRSSDTAFNSFTGFHYDPEVARQYNITNFQFLHRIPLDCTDQGACRCEEDLSIPSPDSTRPARNFLVQLCMPFNSFTGFHNRAVPPRWRVGPEDFQFLHRIPPPLAAGSIVMRGKLSIPSPDSTCNRPARCRRARALSIPSPDSTMEFGARNAGGAGTLSIPSPDSTRSRITSHVVASSIFQFLHRIPPNAPTIKSIAGRTTFQFLHRIPLVPALLTASCSSSFNSFTGFHWGAICGFHEKRCLSIPSPDSTFARLMGKENIMLHLSIPSPDSTSTNLNRELKICEAEGNFQFLHRIPQ